MNSELARILSALQVANRHNLKGGALIALLLLAKGPATQTQIAKAAGHTTASATLLRDRLVELGFVESAPVQDANDRRVFYATISAAGLEAVRSILNAGNHEG